MSKVPLEKCKAKSKRSGVRCKRYPANGSHVCVMHGARGGPKTEEGLKKCKEIRTTHGFYSKEAKADRKSVRDLLKKN